MRVTRKFTTAGQDPFATVEWTTRSSKISNPDGSVVFEMPDAEVPATWSQLATDIMVSKYFRKAGVPQFEKPYALPNTAQAVLKRDMHGNTVTGPERSARQVIHRLAGCWRFWGETHGYFDTPEDAQSFYDELVYMMVHQMCAPNSPQWFNTGLNWAYGINGPAQGHFVPDPKTGEVFLAADAYTHPQPHACQPHDALVFTPQGPIPIGEIVERQLTGLEVFDGREDGLGRTRVVAAKANGEKPVFRIVLKNGACVEATADHLVWALDEQRGAGEWRRVDALAPGMRMQLSTRTTVEKESSEQAVREAALAGWLQGDGFVGQYAEGTNRSLTVEFMTIDDDEFAFVMENVGRVFEGVHHHVRSVPTQGPELDVRRIRLYGEKLRPFVEKYGLLRGDSDLEVPAAVRTGGAAAQAAYLRALFQTDGTVRLRPRASRTADVVLTTVSEPLARGVQSMLSGLGIYARVQQGVETRENRRTPYFVSIGYADARSRFRDLIGFTSEAKRCKLESACSDRFPGKALPGLRDESILRIEAIGTLPVYDIQTESGQYLSNGFIVHNCFIQSISDDLVNPGGIMDLWVREARLFKYGSGTGTNFSRLRGEGERLSGGGKSSGLMSWLKIGDRAAAAIKSGGTTRRAAKMVCLDMDHPDIEDFVNWKVREEIKVAAMVEGLRLLKREDESIRATAERLGLELDYDFNGEAYLTVSGQNSNNSVRIPDEFFDALDADSQWQTTWRTTGEVARTYKARKLWDDIGYAAWRCADPGVQYDGTINAWHTCPNGGRINASNPCSEYMFLDDTACNLASLNVMTFFDAETRIFDAERFEHAIDLWTTVLEVSVLMAAYPSQRIAELSYRYRTLGLGYANLGAMLMQAGIAYDSDEARAVCGCLTAILTGRSYRQSALLAGEHGPFPGFETDRDNMLRVVRNHRRAAKGVSRDAKEWEGLRVRPVPIDHALCASGRVDVSNMETLAEHATRAWDDALAFGERHGYRNAQVTVIAPTGTIGLLMDCDTTGVEPDFALVKFKKLAGGGYFKIVNESVRPALESLGYEPDQIKGILTYILGTLHLEVPMPDKAKGAQPGETFAQWLRGRGLNEEDLAKVTRSLRGVFELSFAFAPWAIGDEACKRLGIDPDKAKSEPGFNTLRKLGLRDKQIEQLNEAICGTQTVEGAPHLRPEHLPVFDCANKCGKKGERFIAPEGHIRMMAAAQPFISGAISKTINLPNEAKVEDIERCYRMSWELGLKANALYRDGCKLSQPLSTKVETAADTHADEEIAHGEGSAPGESQAPAGAASGASVPVAATAPGKVESEIEAMVQIVHRPMRRRLPDTRSSLTHKFNIAGHEGYLTVGLYDDGKPGELFITMAKEGSTIGGLMDSLGTATSVALQYGVPVESLVNKFTHQRFEPAGMTTNRDIPFAKSLVDYIFRWMGIQFIPGYREANSPQRPGEAARPASERLPPAPEPPRLAGVSPARRAPAPVITASATVTERIEQGDAAYQATQTSTLSLALDSVNDAPPCDVCGTITVRSGTCYKCLNCGNSMGCS